MTSFQKKFYTVGNPLQLPTLFQIASTPLKFPLSRKNVKNGFGVPNFGEGMPQILDMYFQVALTSEHVAAFGWVPFSELWESDDQDW